jgi:hypothetical protein
MDPESYLLAFTSDLPACIWLPAKKPHRGLCLAWYSVPDVGRYHVFGRIALLLR